jgi:sporulation protein YlmC with PRC-barrel domain
MFDCYNEDFSDLKNKDVLDANGEKIGKVIDFVVRFQDNRITLKSLILGGIKIEEFLEAVGAKPDIDPIFQLDCIDRIEENIILSVAGDTLKTTLDPNAIEQGDMKLSELSKYKIIDADGFNIGKVINIWFDTADEIWLVLGGSFVEETLEKLSIQPDIDLLIPQEHIKNISDDKIHLKWTKFQLSSTCTDAYEKYKRELASRHDVKDPRHEQIRLIGAPPIGRA